MSEEKALDKRAQRFKKVLRSIILGFLIALLFYFIYSLFLAPTKIALINFPSYQMSSMVLSNTDKHIEVREVEASQASSLTDYDAILLFGPGLRLTKGQIDQIKKAGDKGKAVYTFVFNSNIIENYNVDSIQQQELDAYYSNRSVDNFSGILSYVREQFDGDKLFIQSAPAPVEVPNDLFYYLDDRAYYQSAEELTEFLKQQNIYKPDAPRIALISGMTSPLEGNRTYLNDLITSLSDKGFNVYPLSSFTKRVEMMKEVHPDAVVYLPMGRLGNDETVEWLNKNNIPLFSPYSVMQTRSEWLEDPRGQIGGFLTARIVLPEIDGAICSLPISMQNLHDNKYFVFDSEPERLENFTSNVANYLKLRTLPNVDKRIAISYFKGPGQSSLVATGLEVVPSLYNLLLSLRSQGYSVTDLPPTPEAFEKLLQRNGSLISPSASFASHEFMEKGNPLWITKADYEAWVGEQLDPLKYKEVVSRYGEFPGNYMTGDYLGEKALATPYLKFGNVVLFPQPQAGLSGDNFKMVHGTNQAPPHSYIAPYLWMQKEFKAHAIIHFGTHGSLEFTPGKQTAMSNRDWADCLIGATPHFYYYSISNVGEGIIAKRRSHASLISYLTPPFKETNLGNTFDALFSMINRYYGASPDKAKQLAIKIKQELIDLELDRDLELNSDPSVPLSADEINYIESYAAEIGTEKFVGKLYTLGEVYESSDLHSTTLAMSVDPIAYSLAKLDLLKEKISDQDYNNKAFIARNYTQPIKDKIAALTQQKELDIAKLYVLVGLSQAEVMKARQLEVKMSGKMLSMESMMTMAADMKGDEPKAEGMKRPANMPKTGKMPDFVKKMLEERKKNNEVVGGDSTKMKSEISSVDIQFATAVLELDRSLQKLATHHELLELSPTSELDGIHRALSGGYLNPSPGGDLVRNPNTLPTGRNLYSINAEATPSLVAWENAKLLVDETLTKYKTKHEDWPKKVSYTLWAGEFIETEGLTIAQILYMLGVEPVRDGMNRVTDLRLIPSSELGRPRIDVVVQTSGQLRDLAASRLLMITKAVKMASDSRDEEFTNLVAQGTVHTEAELVERGITPQEARELSTMRVFGAQNGQYGTGIMGLVEKGDAWENTSEVADTYMNNMGAIYGDDQRWGAFTKDLFAVALEHTDVVIQPRQNNTWGALSLDHIYEFMGGVNLSIRQVTGKEPESYFADYRNRSYLRMQGLREAIGVEARTTLLNPQYIQEVMKGGASSADNLAKTIRNTYGWDVMKSSVIDQGLWDKLYGIYVTDSLDMGVTEFLQDKSPAALQEITGVMLETARKGLWSASALQLEKLVDVHYHSVKDGGFAGTSFVMDNQKLQAYIANQLEPSSARDYKESINPELIRSSQKVKSSEKQGDESVVLKKEEMNRLEPENASKVDTLSVVLLLLGLFSVLILALIIRRKKP